MLETDIKFVKECIKKNDIHKFYASPKWRRLRQQVLAMDHYECQDCKKKGIYTKATTVHHNQFVQKHPENALDIFYTFKGQTYRNLISLCHDCHEKRHGNRQGAGKMKQKEYLTEERW
ncbi:MAG TPA: HNH endonuclease [Lachnospiraceae bacterium]|nr:HNH endonuclease [Lachnospiraceae bacterium]